ncbi:peptide chain release factor 1 [Flavilitoribacter nigricans]|uniref:Uncharacterized protein n=1 Tax=Flavilitoribacter nigricans (strain ATCC 23147 / DSM 23189 / NBRC 102662 / NCIMB 1420 / SS-2) TaxID=1122177 RepID=A0A2D0N999_FLAN2|nr:hypothetical protein [Flavilitoribacter nigricans]PHN05101.1 hypothetical protein CRP01_18950 [Flavilitoribacter nigricans DSM 23189 = NBRC 102662]
MNKNPVVNQKKINNAILDFGLVYLLSLLLVGIIVYSSITQSKKVNCLEYCNSSEDERLEQLNNLTQELNDLLIKVQTYTDKKDYPQIISYVSDGITSLSKTIPENSGLLFEENLSAIKILAQGAQDLKECKEMKDTNQENFDSEKREFEKDIRDLEMKIQNLERKIEDKDREIRDLLRGDA